MSWAYFNCLAKRRERTLAHKAKLIAEQRKHSTLNIQHSTLQEQAQPTAPQNGRRTLRGVASNSSATAASVVALILFFQCGMRNAECGIAARHSFEPLVDAIYLAEGGARARVPYGILSMKVSGPAQARRACLVTVHNNYSRWLRAGRREHFVDFLADRYCPPSADRAGNHNWKRNVKRLLANSALRTPNSALK